VRTRRRVVVDGGWADWSVDHDDVYCVDGVDHRWLFPQLTAAVHHAGAGTTGAAVLSGVPSVPVPVALDQPFWARRLFNAGLASRPILARKLTAAGLAAAIEEVTSSGAVAETCRELAAACRSEDGLQAVRRAVDAGQAGGG
jgi:sterol 3beta-glucosyltransferase